MITINFKATCPACGAAFVLLVQEPERSGVVLEWRMTCPFCEQDGTFKAMRVEPEPQPELPSFLDVITGKVKL